MDESGFNEEKCRLCKLPIKADESRRSTGDGKFAHNECYWRSEAAAIPACKRAIRLVLNRIKVDDVIRYHMGVGTQTFTDLCVAASQLFDEPIDQVANHFIPGSGGLTKQCAEAESGSQPSTKNSQPQESTHGS